MIAISDYIQNLNFEIEKAKEIAKNRRVSLKLDNETFKSIFLLEAKKEMLKRAVNKDFEIDSENAKLINQLFYYITADEKFDGDLNKGVLIMGSVGAGKTLILTIFCNIIENLAGKVITRTHAKRAYEMIKEKPKGYYDKRPVFIDDLGREQKEITDYGTKEQPLIDLFSIRYDNGALTFATTNFNIDSLSEFYGEAIADRFKEMFNFIIIKSKSRR